MRDTEDTLDLLIDWVDSDEEGEDTMDSDSQISRISDPVDLN